MECKLKYIILNITCTDEKCNSYVDEQSIISTVENL